MPTTLSRLTSNGNLYLAGTLDEATFNPNSGYRKNLLSYSEDLTNGFWSKGNATVSANQIIAPNGTLTADKIVENTTASQYHFVSCLITTTKPAVSLTYTYSIYAKNAGRHIGLRIENGISSGAIVEYNLSTGSVFTSAGVYGSGTSGASGTITSVGDGWYRLSLSVTLDSTITTVYAQSYLYSVAAASTVYTGDGTSGVYLWGAQMENNSTATIYEATGANTTPSSNTLSKLDSSGNYYTLGTIDEVTFNPNTGYKQNLLKDSKLPSSASWLKGGATVSLTANTLSPDGTSTAYKLVEGTNTGEHLWYQSYNNTNVTVTQSCYFKSDQRTQAYLSLSNFATESCQGQFNLAAGTFVTAGGGGPDFTNVSATMKNVGNGWYRCSLTATKGSVNTNCIPTVAPLVGGTSVYTGDGTSGIFVWGPQLEFGSNVTIYVPTDANSLPSTSKLSILETSGNNYIIGTYDEVTNNINAGGIAFQ